MRRAGGKGRDKARAYRRRSLIRRFAPPSPEGEKWPSGAFCFQEEIDTAARNDGARQTSSPLENVLPMPAQKDRMRRLLGTRGRQEASVRIE